MPAITVLMSVYNGELYLRSAIESILQQTCTDFEFLIINDASTDHTAEILSSCHDPRICLIENPHNLGLTASLNRGLQLAMGTYIARQDADDLSLPTRLEKQKRFLDLHPEVGLAGSSFHVINRYGKQLAIQHVLTDPSALKDALLTSNQFCHGTAMFRKTAAYNAGMYREVFQVAQDYDFWLRISEQYWVANIPSPLYQWRLTGGSISATRRIQQAYYDFLARELAKERKFWGRDRLQKTTFQSEEPIHEEFRRHFCLDKNRILNDYVHWSYLLRINKDYAEAFHLLKQGILLSPFYPKVWEQLAKLLICRLLPECLIQALTRTVQSTRYHK